jgi:hypothetical protein
MGLYSKWHGAEVRGAAEKSVRCEGCGAGYSYTLVRYGHGREISILHLENEQARQLAREYAEADLATRLRDECDPVPCPACGWYQAAMLDRARAGFGQRAMQLGTSLLVVGAALLVLVWMGERAGRPVAPLAPLAGLGLAVGGAVLYFRWEGKRKYNPNSAPVADRLAAGRARARLVENSAGAPAGTAAEPVRAPDRGGGK